MNGKLPCKKISNAHMFEAVISRGAAHRRLLDEILNLFGGRVRPVMAQLVESGKLTLADIEEARKEAFREGEAMTVPNFLHLFGNHLWQSTVFVLVAGLPTLFVQLNSARTRIAYGGSLRSRNGGLTCFFQAK